MRIKGAMIPEQRVVEGAIRVLWQATKVGLDFHPRFLHPPVVHEHWANEHTSIVCIPDIDIADVAQVALADDVPARDPTARFRLCHRALWRSKINRDYEGDKA